jgi:hypothetical protein
MGSGGRTVTARIRGGVALAVLAVVMFPSASLGEDAHGARTSSRAARVATARPHTAARGAESACERDPSFGFELLYAHPAGTASRFEALRASLLRAARQASSFVTASTHGAPMRVRIACGIREVALAAPANSAQTFATLRAELLAAGYGARNRKYVTWWDGGSPEACGEASLVNDDRPDPAANQSNEGPSFAFVYEPTAAGFCDWASVLHEMLHTLGAVQDSAPHSTGSGHCTDGNDVMCRGAAVPAARGSGACEAMTLDCGADDYFSARAPRGSYLATHWNVASSYWLARA